MTAVLTAPGSPHARCISEGHTHPLDLSAGAPSSRSACLATAAVSAAVAASVAASAASCALFSSAACQLSLTNPQRSRGRLMRLARVPADSGSRSPCGQVMLSVGESTTFALLPEATVILPLRVLQFLHSMGDTSA